MVISCTEDLALALLSCCRTLSLSGSLILRYALKNHLPGFPGGSVVKNPPANSEDTGSIPDPEDSTCHRTPQILKPMDP